MDPLLFGFRSVPDTSNSWYFEQISISRSINHSFRHIIMVDIQNYYYNGWYSLLQNVFTFYFRHDSRIKCYMQKYFAKIVSTAAARAVSIWIGVWLSNKTLSILFVIVFGYGINSEFIFDASSISECKGIKYFLHSFSVGSLDKPYLTPVSRLGVNFIVQTILFSIWPLLYCIRTWVGGRYCVLGIKKCMCILGRQTPVDDQNVTNKPPLDLSHHCWFMKL